MSVLPSLGRSLINDVFSRQLHMREIFSKFGAGCASSTLPRKGLSCINDYCLRLRGLQTKYITTWSLPLHC